MNPNITRDYAIKLWLEEIKYNVKFDSWQKDRIANTETQNKKLEVGTPIAYDNDDANDWLVRQIQDAVDNICGELAWCVRDEGRMQSDEIPEDTPLEWAIQLRFSPHWAGSMRALKSYAHRYVTNYVLWKWYRAGGIPDGESYAAEAEESLEKLYNEARSERVPFTPWRQI